MHTKMEMQNKVLDYRDTMDGMSQEKLAEIVGVSQKTISNIESNIHIPNVLIAMRLARTLKVDIYELFTDMNWEGDSCLRN